MASVERFLDAVRQRRVARGPDLAAQLKLSQSTVSRLVAAVGDRVCRMGRARATRYALTRSLPALGTRLPLYQVNEEGNVRPRGALRLLANGAHWLEGVRGSGAFFEGLPPFACDMSPQGYIGRGFSARYPELGLPPRITDWNDDHRLVALARRGEDCVGDLILGRESLDRFLAAAPEPARRADYPELARASLAGQVGSSAGGEHPKFAVLSKGRHVLVKFATGDTGAAAERWRDLLVCEAVALEVVRAAGFRAATADLFDREGGRFLEVERFDRVGARGRKGLISLSAFDDEYFGERDNWTKAAQRLHDAGRLDAEDARSLRWLDAFGELIGNTDRHFGNVSFFLEDDESLRLAPVYDMLPMLFAPQGASVVGRRFEPRPPVADNLDVWPDAVRHALAYWSRLAHTAELSDGFRGLCRLCREAIAARA